RVGSRIERPDRGDAAAAPSNALGEAREAHAVRAHGAHPGHHDTARRLRSAGMWHGAPFEGPRAASARTAWGLHGQYSSGAPLRTRPTNSVLQECCVSGTGFCSGKESAGRSLSGLVENKESGDFSYTTLDSGLDSPSFATEADQGLPEPTISSREGQ